MMTVFNVSERPIEREFGPPLEQARLHIYVQPLSVDPVNESMQIRVTVMPGRDKGGDEIIPTPSRDLTLTFRHGKTAERIEVRANQPFPAETISVDLSEGSVRDYPFDTFRTALAFLCQDKAEAESGSSGLVPTHVTVWEGILGHQVDALQRSESRAGEIRMELRIRRSGAVRFFSSAVYCAMTVIALCSLTIGLLLFTRVAGSR